jgi:hypothetical protein
MAAIFVLDVPEFRNIIDHAQGREDLRVADAGQGYYRIEADGDLRYNRRELQFNPAIWYSVFSGGLVGRIAEFGRTDVVISDEGKAG